MVIFHLNPQDVLFLISVSIFFQLSSSAVLTTVDLILVTVALRFDQLCWMKCCTIKVCVLCFFLNIMLNILNMSF